MGQQADDQALESLSRQAGLPLDSVVALYKRELGALTESARIMIYVPLLAVGRVRRALRHPVSQHNESLHLA
jgi:hypothetical protein